MQIYSEKVLYLIGGPNGSGKTTLVRDVLHLCPAISFLNSDEIARDNNIGTSNAGLILLDRMDELFSRHNSFVYETTLAGKFPGKLVKRARDAGYTIEFFYVVLSSIEQNLARVSERAARGGHNVPENIIRRRHDKSLFNFDIIYKLVDSWKLYNNAGAKCCLVAHGAGDKIDIVEPGMYNDFIETKTKTIEKYITEMAARRAARLQRI